ncbi:MAG TPA: hypothetical protein VK633_12545, partial [Verrucomicrobiae bacterium]|nr:hypothetical protein [Verrucomicrobiae bacterium]
RRPNEHAQSPAGARETRLYLVPDERKLAHYDKGWGKGVQKNFNKNQKITCQGTFSSLILTAKPNQTNGETNEKNTIHEAGIRSHRPCGWRRNPVIHRERLRSEWVPHTAN